MKNKEYAFLSRESRMELLITFFTSTTLVCILEGILGSMFYPGMKIDFGAFFSPPLFGLLSVLFGLLAGIKSSKRNREIEGPEAIIRRLIHLILIMGSVFLLNAVNGRTFSVSQSILIIFSVTIIYLMVYLVIYLNDRKNALDFNQKLKNYQEKNHSTAC